MFCRSLKSVLKVSDTPRSPTSYYDDDVIAEIRKRQPSKTISFILISLAYSFIIPIFYLHLTAVIKASFSVFHCFFNVLFMVYENESNSGKSPQEKDFEINGREPFSLFSLHTTKNH